MIRILKRIICVVVGVTASCSAFGFSLWGPAETFQTQDLDYGDRYLPFFPLPDTTLFSVEGPGSFSAFNIELGGTKNISQGSRLNVPTITYAYDSSFLSYFGAKGVAAVDSAFAVLNGLPAASSTSAKLTGFITQGNQQVNYTAEALRMLDLKSTVLWLMMEHMGMIGETHTYDLEERVALPGGTNACDFDYVVLQRNFDPITYSPSQYVNGALLTYQIGDLCDLGVAVADAMEQSVQVGTPAFSSVATRESLQVGGYYLRITRDDMGGLKYLYRKNHYVNEGLDASAAVSGGVSAYNPVVISSTNTVTNTTTTNVFSGLFGGVEKITFVKTAYDSGLGTGFTPRMYHYTMPMVTNGVLRSVSVTRTLTAPDIIFTAGDLTFPGPDPYQLTVVRTGNFITYGEPIAPAGAVNTVYPAVISPEMVVTFNNSGQVYYNQGTKFLDQLNSTGLGYIWGSFNGTTNAPVPFPTGTSIEEIEGQVLSAGQETESGTFNLGVYNPVSGTNAITTVP